MNSFIIVTDRPKLLTDAEGYSVMTPQDFIAKSSASVGKNKRVKVINLSNSYDYLSRGYYVSLLAEARGLQCVPDLANVVTLNWRRNYAHSFPELNALLEKTFDLPFEEPLVRRYTSFFGRHQNPKLEPLARRIFDLFRLPIFSFELKYSEHGKWVITRIDAGALGRLVDEQVAIFNQDLARFTGSAWKAQSKKKQERYWLAILHNPQEKNAPSNPAALKKFIEVAKKLDVWVELITKDDFSSLLEYDALFIRETTAINNHTFRFAQKAELEDIPTIDDTNSIIKCCNKVYLNELLEIHKIDRPKTVVLDRKSLAAQAEAIDFPAVIKIPDGAFSLGVFKVASKAELLEKAQKLLDKSEVIICQEFLPSLFDWRIGVLNGQPLFASKYYMAAGHWQIYNHAAKSAKKKSGDDEAVPLDQVPKQVMQVALAAAKLIGDGLYGIDIKELENGRVVVIEVNDNPNIDHGVEDKIVGEELYRSIIKHIIAKIEA
jgi:glutathione synthase/RimK-type ligase-like ATP-grasp enzyme